jgi:hypothetical protein
MKSPRLKLLEITKCDQLQLGGASRMRPTEFVSI